MHFASDLLILCRNLGSHAGVRAASHAAGFAVLFLLGFVEMGAPLGEAIQRRNLRREKLIQLRLVQFPMRFVGLHRQVRLGLKEVVKTPFVHLGSLADLVNGNRVVAIFPQKRESHIQQFLFRITGSAHNSF